MTLINYSPKTGLIFPLVIQQDLFFLKFIMRETVNLPPIRERRKKQDRNLPDQKKQLPSLFRPVSRFTHQFPQINHRLFPPQLWIFPAFSLFFTFAAPEQMDYIIFPWQKQPQQAGFGSDKSTFYSYPNQNRSSVFQSSYPDFPAVTIQIWYKTSLLLCIYTAHRLNLQYSIQKIHI